MRRKFLAFIFLIATMVSFAGTIEKHLYINRGVFTTVKNTTFPFLAFNGDTAFNQLNAIIHVLMNDSLQLTIVNHDNLPHGFSIQGTNVSFPFINSGDSVVVQFQCNQHRAFIYFDPLNYPTNRYLGLAGMIYFGLPSPNAVYFWNIKEHQTNYATALAAGSAVNWNAYSPDYYTINSKSFPDLQMDSTAKIFANVGDTVYIVVANTGQSMHSLHFHGFHPKSVFTEAKVLRTGWEKDTWGMFSMEVMVLMMIPDKSGRYSVHDHNLVAVTGGNTHPNGMFTIMEIAP
jgi:Multicopper oxidase